MTTERLRTSSAAACAAHQVQATQGICRAAGSCCHPLPLMFFQSKSPTATVTRVAVQMSQLKKHFYCHQSSPTTCQQCLRQTIQRLLLCSAQAVCRKVTSKKQLQEHWEICQSTLTQMSAPRRLARGRNLQPSQLNHLPTCSSIVSSKVSTGPAGESCRATCRNACLSRAARKHCVCHCSRNRCRGRRQPACSCAGMAISRCVSCR